MGDKFFIIKDNENISYRCTVKVLNYENKLFLLQITEEGNDNKKYYCQEYVFVGIEPITYGYTDTTEFITEAKNFNKIDEKCTYFKPSIKNSVKSLLLKTLNTKKKIYLSAIDCEKIYNNYMRHIKGLSEIKLGNNYSISRKKVVDKFREIIEEIDKKYYDSDNILSLSWRPTFSEFIHKENITEEPSYTYIYGMSLVIDHSKIFIIDKSKEKYIEKYRNDDYELIFEEKYYTFNTSEIINYVIDNIKNYILKYYSRNEIKNIIILVFHIALSKSELEIYQEIIQVEGFKKFLKDYEYLDEIMKMIDLYKKGEYSFIHQAFKNAFKEIKLNLIKLDSNDLEFQNNLHFLLKTI